MIRFDDSLRTLALGVRELLASFPPTGDLRVGPAGRVGRVLASPRARLDVGRATHRDWFGERLRERPGYRREFPISMTTVVHGWTCSILGRVDGLEEQQGEVLVEELKSVLLSGHELEALDEASFVDGRLQLEIYMHLLERTTGRGVRGRLLLVSAVDGRHRAVEVMPEPRFARRVHDCLARLVLAREARIKRLESRRASEPRFAHQEPRAHQAEIAERIREALLAGRHLMLQAPPGAGKTAAVLLGALQVAWRTDARLFFATARNTQQEMAESTLRSMAGRGPEITAVTLRARSRVCLLASRVPGVGARVACGPETCPYAVRYHDRMREGGVIEALLRQGPLTSSGLREFAEARTLCPYQLALDLAPFVDVVVGDYNYVFDPDTASLGLTRETGDPWIVVVDEAHNLADRALQWGSPSLSGPRIEAISDALREAAPCFEAHADRLDRLAGLLERAGSLGDPVWIGDGVHRLEALDPAPFEEILEILESSSLEYLRLALTHACYPLKPATTRARETGDRDGDSVEAGGSDAFLDLGWALSLFVRRLQTIGPETVILHRREGRARADLADPWSLKLLCRDPSPTLGPAFEALAGAVLMSATLDPVDFHRDLLGLDPLRTSFHRVEPFFDPARLRVIVAPSVSTVFRERERHREATAEIVREVALAIPGNCALLFSSFALRDAVCDGIRLPGRRLVHQQPGMGDGDRERILAALRAPDLSEPLVLLGVLGGIFAEGVDLPGDALLGVVIVGPALPTVSLERELLREWFQHRWQDGFKLAYLVPGMSRVLQAAGRVTRSEADRGVVVLVDRRFLQNDYTVFFPPTWTPLRSTRPWTQVATFFAEVGGTGHALDTGATRSISYALSNLLEPVS